MSRRFELFQKALDTNGDPVSGATLEFFEGGTSFTTPKDVYSDAGLTVPIAQPIQYNAAGDRSADIFCDSALYDVRFTVGSTVTTIANYDPGLGAGFGVSSVVGVAQGGTGANNPASARTNIGAAASSALTSTQDDVTALQTAIQPGLNESDTLGTIAALNEISRDNLATSFGTLAIQTVDATPYTANADLTTLIPADDTTPLISEGTEILTANITPSVNGNGVRISIDGFGYTTGTGTYAIWAIFRNSTCIYVKAQGANSVFIDIATLKIDSPATTSQVTYSVRISPAGSGIIRMNGNSSGRLFNGVASCTMRLEELEAI